MKLANHIPNIHKEGYFFIILFALASLIIGSFFSFFGAIGFILTIWCVYFFRDPERITPIGDNFVISPADGVVQSISMSPPPEELEMEDITERVRVSIFLSVFNVHVNRIPSSGKIKKLFYHPGKFFNASLDKASIHNERQSVLMETKNGDELVFAQIAGLIARRIICDLEEEQEVTSGTRFGIIRFGSRMDVYLPHNVAPKVVVGQKMVAGETIIADLASNISVEGEIR